MKVRGWSLLCLQCNGYLACARVSHDSRVSDQRSRARVIGVCRVCQALFEINVSKPRLLACFAIAATAALTVPIATPYLLLWMFVVFVISPFAVGLALPPYRTLATACDVVKELDLLESAYSQAGRAADAAIVANERAQILTLLGPPVANEPGPDTLELLHCPEEGDAEPRLPRQRLLVGALRAVPPEDPPGTQAGATASSDE